MLIDAIRLQGFLSYYGQTRVDGRVEPIEVDFRPDSLWLVHGPNGTGKSALVFDAVGLALYGDHGINESQCVNPEVLCASLPCLPP